MDVNIRQATDTDVDTLGDLYFEFHEFHARYLPGHLLPLGEPSTEERADLAKKVAEIIHGKESAILVAELSGQVIGLAEVYIKRPDPSDRGINPAPFAYLQSLAVTEAHRRKGIGRQLLHATEAWAREHGAVDLLLGIWEFPAGPLKFYEKAGYNIYRHSLEKKL
jgi:GNAT superfamily N-acetyltransferase